MRIKNAKQQIKEAIQRQKDDKPYICRSFTMPIFVLKDCLNSMTIKEEKQSLKFWFNQKLTEWKRNEN